MYRRVIASGPLSLNMRPMAVGKHSRSTSTLDSPPSPEHKVHHEKLPVDGLPRYPTATPLGALRLFDYAGTVSFAHSGSLLAAASGMDLLGATMVGTITAVGGGTIRDAVILNSKPFWTSEPEYLYLAMAVAALTFATINPFDYHETMAEVALDALGVGAFCVIGAQNGIRAGVPALVSVICGMATATFGGVVRDVLCDRKVRILHSTSEIYATTAASGAAVYMGVRAAGGGTVARVGAGVGLAMALRGWAWTEGVRLPVWRHEVQVPVDQSDKMRNKN